MLSQQEKAEIYSLLQTGVPVAEIARKINRSIATIYRLRNISSDFVSASTQQQHNQFIDYLAHRLKKGVTNASKIYRELIKQGYDISYGTVNRYLKEIKTKTIKHRGDIPSTRFETRPGEQFQVDWGTFGKIEVNGRPKPLYCFVCVDGYSRMMYIEFTVSQKLHVLENCHMNVFDYMGIPKTIVYDNMKTVVLRREKLPDGTIKKHYHPGFLDFAQHYGFYIRPCWPHWPREKGKVESGVKLVRNDFMQGMKFGRDFYSLDELNRKARYWLDTFANIRKHRTTGKRPVDLWGEEKQYLRLSYNIPRYNTASIIERKATKDGLVQHKLNFYSIPIQYAGRKMYLEEVFENGEELIKIYLEDEPIATHTLSYESGKWIVKDEHLEAPKKSRKEKAGYEEIDLSSKITTEDFTRPLSYYKNLIPDIDG